jgi:hypothetical protein
MEKVDTPVNLRLVIGQLAIVFLILGGLGLSYLNFSGNSYSYAVPILCWTVVFISIGIWTRHNPKLAFLTSLIVYTTSVIIKDIFLGGEYLLPFIFHTYFIISMVVGINSVQKKGR